MSGTWLFGASLWKIVKALLLYEIVHVSLFYDKRSWNSECPGQWQGLMVFDGIWLSKSSTLTHKHAISNL